MQGSDSSFTKVQQQCCSFHEENNKRLSLSIGLLCCFLDYCDYQRNNHDLTKFLSENQSFAQHSGSARQPGSWDILNTAWFWPRLQMESVKMLLSFFWDNIPGQAHVSRCVILGLVQFVASVILSKHFNLKPKESLTLSLTYKVEGIMYKYNS